MDSRTRREPLSAEQAKQPWKYIGYQGFSHFVASEVDFFILRRFDQLASWALLRRQDELAELEDQLATVEARLRDPRAKDVHNGSFREETQKNRKDLLDEIDAKLQEYYEFVNKVTQIRSRPKVDKLKSANITNWFDNHPHAIHRAETEYIDHRKDLFSVTPRTISPLRGLLERSSHFRLSFLWEKERDDDGTVLYTSEQRIDFFVSTIILILGLSMLIAPLWILAFVEDRVKRLGIITAFIAVLLPLLTYTSNAKPFEALAATAA